MTPRNRRMTRSGRPAWLGITVVAAGLCAVGGIGVGTALASSGPPSSPGPPSADPSAVACQKAGHIDCRPAAAAASPVSRHGPGGAASLAGPDAAGARLLTKRQVLTAHGLGTPKAGQTVSARRMTYGQAQQAHPALAAASAAAVNPGRVVWVVTVSHAKPVSYRPCARGFCPPGQQNRTVQVSKWSEVIDAATGQVTDAGTGG